MHIRELEAALDGLAKYAISEEGVQELRGLENKEGEQQLPRKKVIDQGLSELTTDG